jgi:hypothetical protein
MLSCFSFSDSYPFRAAPAYRAAPSIEYELQLLTNKTLSHPSHGSHTLFAHLASPLVGIDYAMRRAVQRQFAICEACPYAHETKRSLQYLTNCKHFFSFSSPVSLKVPARGPAAGAHTDMPRYIPHNFAARSMTVIQRADVPVQRTDRALSAHARAMTRDDKRTCTCAHARAHMHMHALSCTHVPRQGPR